VTAHSDARARPKPRCGKDAGLTGGLGLPPGLGLGCHRCPLPVAGPEIERLIQLLARLPGSARARRDGGTAPDQETRSVDDAPGLRAEVAIDRIQVCKTCGNIDTQNPCTCAPIHAAMARSSSWSPTSPISGRWSAPTPTNGRYHVLVRHCRRSTASGPQDLTIDALVKRAHAPEVGEDHPGAERHRRRQTTAHYITDLLADANVKVTRLAHGLPVGGELDYLDEGTLSAAMRQRTLF